MRFYIYLFAISFISGAGAAQHDPFDPGQADTMALEIGYFHQDNQNAKMAVEVWVYSDNPISTFVSGFKWDNSALHLDSASPAPLLLKFNPAIFLYYQDSYIASNNMQIFTLGGITFGNPIESSPWSRRLWATYYFTLENWNPNDSFTIDIVSAELVDFRFVRMGSIYPAGYKPVFSGALKISGITTDIIETEQLLPDEFSLSQNYPNPFNPSTTIEFSLSKKSITLLEIFNVEGKKVETLVNQTLSAGTYKFEWNAKLPDNSQAPTGIYFYRLTSGEFEESNKMILTK